MSIAQPPPLLGELLIRDGAISRSQLEEALKIQAEQGGKLAEILVKLKYLDVDRLGKIIASQPGVASMLLSGHRLSREWCDLIPEEFARSNQVFPIDRMGKTLTIGMAVPLDRATIAAVREMTGLRVQAFYCAPDTLQEAIDTHYRPHGEVNWTKVLAATPKSKSAASDEGAEPD